MTSASSLYRTLLRLQRRWPAEADRPGRNIKDALAKEVRLQFRQNANVTNKEEITLLQSMARADIEALSEVLNNSVKTSFARSPELDAQSIVAFDRRKILSSEGQKELQKGVPFWMRLIPISGRS